MFNDHTLVMLFRGNLGQCLRLSRLRIVGQVKNQSYRKALSKRQLYATMVHECFCVLV